MKIRFFPLVARTMRTRRKRRAAIVMAIDDVFFLNIYETIWPRCKARVTYLRRAVRNRIIFSSRNFNVFATGIKKKNYTITDIDRRLNGNDRNFFVTNLHVTYRRPTCGYVNRNVVILGRIEISERHARAVFERFTFRCFFFLLLFDIISRKASRFIFNRRINNG